jgi:1-acyl-sn-glycerol-3-phosphate acyltransferase
VRQLRAAWRALHVLTLVLSGWWTLRRHFAHWSPARRQDEVQAWSRRMLDAIGVRLQIRGQFPDPGPGLVLANHVSWLDILVINAAWPVRFVSKADVRQWPLVGRLVEGSGTLFIEREKRRDAMRVVHHVAEALAAGDRVAFFPEGTTSDGSTLLPFHANLLQAAVVADLPALPLALRYLHHGSAVRHQAPTYIGDTTLIASLWRTFQASDLVAELHFGPADLSQGRDRRTWSEALRRDMAVLLDLQLAD